MQLSELELIRREKLQKLRDMGINPYPAEMFPVTLTSDDFIKNFEEGKTVLLAGRLMSRRIQGKASFAELQDSGGRIQIYINRDELCKSEDKTLYNEVYKKLLDIGDFIGVEGVLFKTKVGEITVRVCKIKLLCKALRPLPLPKTDTQGNLYDGFNDPELRYRRRYVDLIVNPEVKKTFIKRTKVVNVIRDFLNKKEYLEVETPILQPIPGGATARPFVTHHNTHNTPLYLRIANELYLKQLIVGGFDGVYEFSKDFRNEGMDRTHNPEFTVLELYVSYKDYHWMMDLTEELLEKVALAVNGSEEVILDKKKINFKAPYPRVSIMEAIETHTGFNIRGMGEDELRDICDSLGLSVDQKMGVGKLIDEIFGVCEPHYIQPTFITDYPKEMSPLTKTHRDNPNLTERFELIVNGKELANAYSELNDPIDQRNRFEDQLRLSEKGDDEAMFIDQNFLRALEYGMPPTSGIGIGIDRLVMIMTDNISIQEVLFFPQMRPERLIQQKLSEQDKEIISILKTESPVALSSLRDTFDMSNKSWDRVIKGLVKSDLIKIRLEEGGKMVYLSENKN